jgi:hypothetical protein
MAVQQPVASLEVSGQAVPYEHMHLVQMLVVALLEIMRQTMCPFGKLASLRQKCNLLDIGQ